MAICRVITKDQTKTFEFLPSVRLSELLERAGFAIAMPCGGRGRCGKCAVRAEGEMSPATPAEAKLLAGRPGMRLACETYATGDVELRVEEAGGDSIRIEGESTAYAMDEGEGLGCAVDIGTTTVAMYLYDLKTHERLGVASAPNPQAVYGADVLSRLDRSMAGDADRLQGAIEGCLRELLAKLAGGRMNEVARFVITGNSAMLYLLTRRDPACIARVPFVPDTLFGCAGDPARYGLSGNCRVYLCRSVSAYVGADITCSMLASGFMDGDRLADGTVLMADIGTNGEMGLLHGGKLLCCSTAAGPAFEGAGITMGMNARDGAITKVDLADGRVVYEFLGDRPAGICGSAIVDAVRVMLETGELDETGRMTDRGVRYADAVAWQVGDSGVYITQADVRQVQLAKSALCAGMLALMNAAGIEEKDLDALVIAGGFGSCIRPDSAEAIGLLPEGFAKKARAVGNAAGAGACRVLLSAAEREKSEALSRLGEVLELSTDEFFMDAYVDSMMFPDA